MKKLLILIILLCASFAQADVVIYKGTIAAGAGKFSTVNGTAFFDFGDASYISPGNKICFKDSAGKTA